MGNSTKPGGKSPSAAGRLRAFVAKFDEEDQKLIRSVRAAMRRKLPTANELVWDNYNFLVIGYSPTERPSDSIFSITARAHSVALCFIQGASLPDPHHVLVGTGKQTRSIPLRSAEVLTDPHVEELFELAIRHSNVPLPTHGKGKLVVRDVSEKQRPRRRPRR